MSDLYGQFREAARRWPAATAITTPDGGRMTYRQLTETVDRTRQYLKKAGPGDRVGIFLPRSPAAVVVILAVLSRGAAYVPLDITAPLSRNAFILRQTRPRLVVAASGAELPLAWQAASATPPGEEFVIVQPDDPPLSPAGTVGEAYVLCTSGSTGRPKGVPITDAAARAFTDWAGEFVGIGPGDTVATIAPFHFDLSVFDLFVTLTRGACLLVLPDEIVRNPRALPAELARWRVTVLYATPSLLRLLESHGKLENHDLTSLRRILYAGEAYPVVDLRRLMVALPTARVANFYGPTETNVVCWYDLPGPPGEEATDVPIGSACPYADLLLWDEGPVPLIPGSAAELLVAGASVTAGYLVTELNAAAFLDYDGKRYYRTGDIVSVDDAGRLVFRGRRDRMVKRRGYRVEPAESEAVLAGHPALGRVAVVAGPAKSGGVRLIAYYELRADAQPPTAPELAAYCRRYLPAYLTPDAYRATDAIPLTSTQKIDYRALETITHA